MNNNFVIPDRSSLYNIKSIYNAFIEELGGSGLANLLINGKMNEISRNDVGDLILPGWVSPSNLTGPVVTLGVGEELTQYLPRLYPNTVYTFIYDVRNLADLTVSVIGTPSSQVTDFYDGTVNPVYNIPVSYDDLNQPIQQQVAFTFVTGNHDTIDPPRIEVSSDQATTFTVFNSVISKGTFGFNTDNSKSIFMDMVRLVNDGTNAYYETSTDDVNWHRIITTSPSDISALFVTGDFLTISEMDSRYLRKDVDDTSWGKPTFNAGLTSNNDVTLSGNSNLEISSGFILGNAQQENVTTPTNSFYIWNERGSAPSTGIRYNEGIDKWEFTHDGYEWKVMGSGDGGAGSGNSELEYFAEILDRCGFKSGVYDIFDTNGALDDVITQNCTYIPDNAGFYIPESGTPGPYYLRTRNIWPADATGVDYSMFAHVLTNRTENAGVSIAFSRSTDLGPDVPPAVDSTLWQSWSHNDIEAFSGVTDEFYLRFIIDSIGTEFHSFGLFYGSWSYNFATETRLREYYTVPSNASAPVLVVIPNEARYTPDGESLEVYHNRARLIIDIDYEEVNETTIRMFNDILTGDILEFYEKYGYVLDPAAEQDLWAHAQDTTAHGLDVVWQTINNLTELDTTALGALATHITDTTDAHNATAISFDNTDTTNTNAVEVQTAIEQLDGALTVVIDTPNKEIGVGQVWQVVTRATTTVYTNGTGKPIQINAWIDDGASITLEVNDGVNGWIIIHSHSDSVTTVTNNVTGIIPDTHTYRVTSTDPITAVELR